MNYATESRPNFMFGHYQQFIIYIYIQYIGIRANIAHNHLQYRLTLTNYNIYRKYNLKNLRSQRLPLNH